MVRIYSIVWMKVRDGSMNLVSIVVCVCSRDVQRRPFLHTCSSLVRSYSKWIVRCLLVEENKKNNYSQSVNYCVEKLVTLQVNLPLSQKSCS